MSILFVVAGLSLLLLGGEFLVRGSVALARLLGLSPLLVGMAVVGFGTSSPELVTSLTAALSGKPDLAVGNVVGSNIANVLLILGIGAVIRPMVCATRTVMREGLFMLACAAALVAIAHTGEVDRVTGASMVAGLVAFLAYSYWTERFRHAPSAELHRMEAEAVADTTKSGGIAAALTLLGMVAIIGGAELTVTGAVDIARAIGVDEAVIGLTLVAIGTSLPEVGTSIVAAVRGQAELAIGNVLGSNIFNTLGIVGTTALVQPLSVNPRFLSVDMWVMLGASAVVLPLLLTGRRLSRGEGLLFLAAYGGYTTWLFYTGIA